MKRPLLVNRSTTFKWLTCLSFVILSKGVTAESPDDSVQGPIFLSEPPPLTVIPNNKGAVIQCSVYGNPLPTVTWINSEGVEVQNKSGIVEILYNYNLYLLPFDADGVVPVDHTQIYRCVARNRIGAVISRRAHTTAVIVEQLEKLTVNVHDVWVMRGATAVFKCEINPPFWNDYVTISGWLQGPVNIQSGDRISITPDGKLYVRDVRDTDGYTDFRCIGTSSAAGWVERSSNPAKLYIHDPPAGGTAPTIDGNSLHEMEVEVLGTIELPCIADGWPLPTYRWYKQGVPLNVSNGLKYSHYGGNLVIRQAVLNDSGEYRCNASNPKGMASAVRLLKVRETVVTSISPATQIVDSGQSASLNCSISGYPITDIIWYKDGQEIQSDDRVVFATNTLLEIKSVRRQDQGMYQCVAINSKDEVQATAQFLLGAASPAIVDAFGNQYVQVGQRSSVRCIASGNPTPTITWTLDDEILKERSHLSVGEFATSAGDVVSYVNITSVSLLEGGDYRCVASNKFGDVAHVSRLNVYGVPYIREMRNITATANERLFLKCYVTGYPIQSIMWLRDGRQLPLNHLQQVVNGTLVILKVQKLYDDGEYTCAAVNSADQGMKRSVYISVLEPPVIDAFSVQSRKQGDRVTMSCAVSSGDLPIFIHWTKDGLPIPPDIGVIVEASGPYSSLLKIGDVSPVHDGNYTCHAVNEAAGTTYTAVLHVNVPPRWLIQPEDSFVARKMSVKLECSVTGIPQPKVTWNIKNNGELLSLDLSKTDKYVMFANGTLVIKSATEEDQGHYLCRADNSVGHGISKIIYLTVNVPARFEASQKNYTVPRGQNVTMDCMAIGDKPISVTWNFKNQTVGPGTFNTRFTVGEITTNRGKLSQMSMHPAQRDDTGAYGCTAANEFGYDFVPLYLTVLEPPDAPGNLTLLDHGSRFVVLAWSKPFDGNSPLREYIIEYQNTTGEVRSPIRNVSVTGEALSAKVDNLHPSFLYNIRIRAKNDIGLGLTSHQLSMKMQEEAPNGPPQDVEVIAVGSEKLQVSWKPPAIEHRNGVILGYYIGYQETKTAGQMQVIHKDIDRKAEDSDEDVCSVIITNLQKFTEYVVTVKSYNKVGHGPPSPDIKVTTLEDVPSQPPDNVRGYAVASQIINVAWSPPPLFTLHGVLQGYKILYKPIRRDEDETDANFMKSTTLEVTLNNLEKFTNYSIQVLAYTRKGEGVRSNAIHIRTLEDAPGRPRGIKAVAVNSSNIMASWQPPDSPNGELTVYSIYYNNTSANAQEIKMDISPALTAFLLQDMEANVNYWIRITASTRIGEGESTQIVTVMPCSQAPARISSFSSEVKVSWQAAVLLPCLAVGEPEPNVTWSSQYSTIGSSDKYTILQNGSLYITSVTGTDADNYTCKAKNIHGNDIITYSLSVQVDDKTKSPPKAPVLSLSAVTSSTVQISWLSGSNGGSPILGFLVRYRKDHDIWQEVHLGPKNRSFTASGLLCGTAYKFSIIAINSVGKSESSNTIASKTDGSAPILPPQNTILKTVNSTSIELDLRTWEKDVCPIQFYSIQYQVWGESQWVQVANRINWNTTIYTIEELHTATWYIMKITAYSDAGATDCNIKFATLTFSGSTLEPLSVVHKDESFFYEKLYIMVPMCATFVVLIVVSVGVALFCVRRRQVMRYKENSTKIGRDVTAETSLMNDLDKRITYEIDDPDDSRFNCRNVNLLISLTSDENLSGNNSGWCFHDSSKTTSDNASMERLDEDANINPYATFNELKLVFNENPTYHVAGPDSDDDSISLEKAEAQKAMEGTSDNRDGSKFTTKQSDVQPAAEKHSYDNQAMALSPRKYASADQIHALFTMGPPRPQSAYSKNRSQGTRSTPSDKGSQRHSLISSVTTVSSSRDELMEAFENLNRNPPPPVVYETEADSLSQPTDSLSTEPGICLFTESPPQPNEKREASCEVPRYESPDDNHYKESHVVPQRPDTFERESHTISHRPDEISESRSSAKRYTCSSVQKTKGGKESMNKDTSGNRPNTRPRCIEEVTYIFSDEKSPSRTRKLHSLEEKLKSAKEEFGTSVWRRGGRRTPHARTRYDTTVQTPGTADNKPLVSSQLMSVQDETPEDEEAVSLLDRLYRPVPARRKRDALTLDEQDHDDYTEHFTVV